MVLINLAVKFIKVIQITILIIFFENSNKYNLNWDKCSKNYSFICTGDIMNIIFWGFFFLVKREYWNLWWEKVIYSNQTIDRATRQTERKRKKILNLCGEVGAWWELLLPCLCSFSLSFGPGKLVLHKFLIFFILLTIII